MKELNRFRQFLSENQNYVINSGEDGKKITEIFNFSSNKGYTEKTIFSDETKKVEFMDAVRRKLRQLTGDKFDYVDDEDIFDIFKGVVGYDQAYGNRKRDYMNDLDNVVVDIIRELRNDLSLYI
jgi:hypothetical protein